MGCFSLFSDIRPPIRYTSGAGFLSSVIAQPPTEFDEMIDAFRETEKETSKDFDPGYAAGCKSIDLAEDRKASDYSSTIK